MNMRELKLSDVKVLRVTKSSPTSVLYKNSYADDFKETTIVKVNPFDTVGTNEYKYLLSIYRARMRISRCIGGYKKCLCSRRYTLNKLELL